MVKHIVVSIAAIVISIMIIGLLGTNISGNIVKEQNSKDETTVIYFPGIADLQNTDEGTIVFEFSLPSGFKSGNKSADVLMFLESDTLPGLKIGYNVAEKRVYGGLPMMSFGPIEILDSSHHKLAFSFSRSIGKQALLLDDQLMVEAEFTGQRGDTPISGFAVKNRISYIESELDILSYSDGHIQGVR